MISYCNIFEKQSNRKKIKSARKEILSEIFCNKLVYISNKFYSFRTKSLCQSICSILFALIQIFESSTQSTKDSTLMPMFYYLYIHKYNVTAKKHLWTLNCQNLYDYVLASIGMDIFSSLKLSHS